jgi:protein involved in polysaccharide export with SLBB domain
MNKLRLIIYLGVLSGIAFCGCVSNPLESKRLTRYTPKVGERSSWFSDGASSSTVSEPDASGVKPFSADNTSSHRRLLKRGDRLAISIRDITTPLEIRDVLDDVGCVNLPLIGTIKLEGKTSSEAESVIENAYIAGEYYKKINVIVVAQDDEYFIRGEVQKPGKYPLSSDLTLMRAIAEAGGYTEYAKPRDIKVYRGEEVMTFDAKKIESGKERDPMIKPRDIVVVQRTSI